MRAILIVWLMLVGKQPAIEVVVMPNIATCEIVAKTLKEFASKELSPNVRGLPKLYTWCLLMKITY